MPYILTSQSYQIFELFDFHWFAAVNVVILSYPNLWNKRKSILRLLLLNVWVWGMIFNIAHRFWTARFSTSSCCQYDFQLLEHVFFPIILILKIDQKDRLNPFKNAKLISTSFRIKTNRNTKKGAPLHWHTSNFTFSSIALCSFTHKINEKIREKI